MVAGIKKSVKKPAVTLEKKVKKPAKDKLVLKADKKKLDSEELEQIEERKKEFYKQEKERISLLLKLSEITDEETIRLELKDFSKGGKSDKLFGVLVYTIPSKFYKELAEKFGEKAVLQQQKNEKNIQKNKQQDVNPIFLWSTMTLLDFIEINPKMLEELVDLYNANYKTSKTFEEIKNEIVKESDKITSSFLTKSQKEAYDRFMENIKKDRRKIEERQPENKKSVFLDKDGNVISIEQRNLIEPSDFLYTDMLFCLKYEEKPWIENYDGKFYVTGVIDNKLVNETNLVSEESIIFQNKKYFKSNQKLNQLFCTAFTKKQKKYIFSGQFRDKKLFELEIVYKTKNSFVKQDEDLFNLELNWISSQNNEMLSIKQSVQKFLDTEPVEKDSKFSKYIVNIFSLYFDKESSNSILNYFVTNSKGNMKYFMERVAKLMIFLDPNYLGSKIPFFHKKLEKNVYNLEDLYTLSEKEILQEIYENPQNYIEDDNSIFEDKFSNFTDNIRDQINLFIFNTVKNFVEDPTKRQSGNFAKYINPPKNINVIQSSNQCQNDFGEIKWDTIYYRDPETNKLYCFNLLEIVQQIYSGDFVNHHTNMQFSSDFVKSIKKYSLEKIQKIYEVKKPVDLKINFLDVLLNDLNKKEISLTSSECSSEKIKKYYKDFVLTEEDPLTKKLQKTSEELEKINDFVNDQSLHEVALVQEPLQIFPQRVVKDSVESVSIPLVKQKVKFSKVGFGQKKI